LLLDMDVLHMKGIDQAIYPLRLCLHAHSM
jgi:hypothetical protein